MDDLWALADSYRRTEVRLDCPYCSKRKGDKTLSLNTQKRVGVCHRCEWKVGGKAPESFVAPHLDDLERERKKRTFKFEQIKSACQPISEGDIASYIWITG